MSTPTPTHPVFAEGDRVVCMAGDPAPTIATVQHVYQSGTVLVFRDADPNRSQMWRLLYVHPDNLRPLPTLAETAAIVAEVNAEPEPGPATVNVWNLEGNAAPELLGAYVCTDEDCIVYETPDGNRRSAPQDCVAVTAVDLIAAAAGMTAHFQCSCGDYFADGIDAGQHERPGHTVSPIAPRRVGRSGPAVVADRAYTSPAADRACTAIVTAARELEMTPHEMLDIVVRRFGCRLDTSPVDDLAAAAAELGIQL